MFELRIAKPDDEAGIGELLSASYPRLMRAAYEATVLEAALPLMIRANPKLLLSGTFYVAETVGGSLVGCGGWTSERPATGEIEAGLGHIRHFATHPEWTGKGVGRQIYALCEDTACRAGISRFECYSSLNAEGFYASMGFRRVSPFVVQMTPDVALPSVLMTRNI